MELLHADESGNTVETLAQFDLQRELAECIQKKPWPSGIHSKLLFKKPDFRCVLIAMEPSATMKEHHADGTISIQVLKGRLRFGAEGSQHELATGTLLTLGASIKHDVQALEDSAFLLTISWPSNQELLSMKHRGYGT
ncbi:MAG TPA: cupin domain-containing protein [Acidobacteriaceae bacterium]|nr:cupin domain-containing protein [Acidobacteriaceae bacterium]